MWNSWKNEQRFVKFYLKKSSSISFRHNQPSKSLRSRRKRPNFIGAEETFIDGPIGSCGQYVNIDESAATSESTSGTTTSGDTFGSPSELSLTTTNTTTTTTTESDSDQNCKHSTNQGKYYPENFGEKIEAQYNMYTIVYLCCSMK